MAPLRGSRSISSLQVPPMAEHAPRSMAPFYSSNTLSSCSTTHLSTILSSSSTSDLEDFENSAVLSPRTLYAQSFDRPASARSLPSGRFRKNMKEITGFGTTEEDFEALPIAIQRKYVHQPLVRTYHGLLDIHCRDIVYQELGQAASMSCAV